MKKIGLFYAPKLGSTEVVAKKIAEALGEDNVDLILVDEKTKPEDAAAYDKLILGLSTVGRDQWDNSYGKIGWDFFLPKIADANLDGKTVAMFGLGNHITYPTTFVDGLGLLGQELAKTGAKVVGQVETEEYEFSESEAVVNDKFVGLPLDHDNDEDLTDERVARWVAQIKQELL